MIIAVLFLANGWRHGFISANWLKEHKDALSALSSIFTVFILIAGSSFSYFRFFRGRTFSLRADLSINVSVHDSGGDFNLHAITLAAKNVGASTIWNPRPLITIEIHSIANEPVTERIDNWWKEPLDHAQKRTVPLIESTETVMFFAQRRIPKASYAVTYRAQLKADSGDNWYFAKTVSNVILEE